MLKSKVERQTSRSKSLKSAGAALALAACSVQADSLIDAVQMAADSKSEIAVMIAGKPAQVIYAGQFNGCEQVAVQRQRSSQQNFEVCNGTVRDKHSVAPSWPLDSSVRQMLSMVVAQALLRGHSRAVDSNGYSIDAARQFDVGSCSSVAVKVTFGGDLVDYAVQRVCD